MSGQIKHRHSSFKNCNQGREGYAEVIVVNSCHSLFSLIKIVIFSDSVPFLSRSLSMRYVVMFCSCLSVSCLYLTFGSHWLDTCHFLLLYGNGSRLKPQLPISCFAFVSQVTLNKIKLSLFFLILRVDEGAEYRANNSEIRSAAFDEGRRGKTQLQIVGEQTEGSVKKKEEVNKAGV